MVVQQALTVNFGKSRAGLSTVGYALFDIGGSLVSNRTAVGVYELSGSTGIYGANVALPDGFNGTIIWDSGQAGANLMIAAEGVYAPVVTDLRLIVSASIQARGGVLSGSTTSVIRTTISASNDFFNGYALRIIDPVSGSGTRFIDQYQSGSGTFNLDVALPFAPSSGSTVFVISDLDQNFGGIG